MPRKQKPKTRAFYHTARFGEHWAKISVEWSEDLDTPELWKANAEAVAEKAFMAVDLAHEIVSASSGKSVKA